jgi:hypothetical protein
LRNVRLERVPARARPVAGRDVVLPIGKSDPAGLWEDGSTD